MSRKLIARDITDWLDKKKIPHWPAKSTNEYDNARGVKAYKSTKERTGTPHLYSTFHGKPVAIHVSERSQSLAQARYQEWWEGPKIQGTYIYARNLETVKETYNRRGIGGQQ